MMHYESPVNQDTTCPPNIDYKGYKVLETCIMGIQCRSLDHT